MGRTDCSQRSLRSLPLVLCLAATPLICSAGALPAGVERTDANSRAAHQALLRKRHSGRIDVYFLGDSITRRWGTSDPQYRDLYASWRRNFYGWNAADFGWGSDTTWNILWRIRNGELEGVNPRIIVLLAGTNDLRDLPHPGQTSDEAAQSVTAGVGAIVRACQAQAPRATLVLTGLAPRGDRPELRPIIERINAGVAALADGRAIRFVDLYARLTDSSGAPLPGMLASDGLHFSVSAYQAWADALRPILREILGARRATDAAPPPSNDPGLR